MSYVVITHSTAVCSLTDSANINNMIDLVYTLCRPLKLPVEHIHKVFLVRMQQSG